MQTPFNEHVRSILVLEDDSITKKLWFGILDKLGLPWEKVDWATSQAHFEARFKEKLSRHGAYDLVICDILIPGEKNGIDLWREYRQYGSTFCFVSSMSETKYQEMLKPGEEHSCLYIAKPLEPEKCFEILNSLAFDHLVRSLKERRK